MILARKAFLMASVCTAVITGSVPVHAGAEGFKEAGDWMVRARAIAFLPQEGQDIELIGGEADASNDYVPEIDVSYFLTDNWALELVLVTTHHDMDVLDSTAGNVDLGDVGVVPPVLALQYHFDGMGSLNASPYLGAGLNYTMFYGADAASGSAATDVEYENSFGYALQAGVDVPVSSRLFLNLDVKKVWVDTNLDVTLAGGQLIDADIDLDPWILGVGVGYKF